jgi:hypothetical protein
MQFGITVLKIPSLLYKVIHFQNIYYLHFLYFLYGQSRHAIQLQFNISTNGLEIRAYKVQSVYSLMSC